MDFEVLATFFNILFNYYENNYLFDSISSINFINSTDSINSIDSIYKLSSTLNIDNQIIRQENIYMSSDMDIYVQNSPIESNIPNLNEDVLESAMTDLTITETSNQTITETSNQTVNEASNQTINETSNQNETQTPIVENETQIPIIENETQIPIIENETQIPIIENENNNNLENNAFRRAREPHELFETWINSYPEEKREAILESERNADGTLPTEPPDYWYYGYIEPWEYEYRISRSQ